MNQTRTTIGRVSIVRGNYRITPTPPLNAARGTGDLGVHAGAAMAEHQVGMALQRRQELTTLGRNMATAAGLEFAYRLGRAHDSFEQLGRRR